MSLPDQRQFDIYLKELLEWNQKLNLTAITDPAEIRTKHFEDSLTLLQVLPLTDQSVIDVGSGAGFPGIPLKIACPGIKLTLLESTRKKANFLKHIISLLSLKDAEAVWGRAEEYAHQKREAFDLAVSRALAETNVLVEYCLPLVKVGGTFVAYKEQAVEEEVARAKNAIQTLGGKLKEIRKIELAGTGIARSLVIVSKIAPTPPHFPRRPGMAKKRPL